MSYSAGIGGPVWSCKGKSLTCSCAQRVLILCLVSAGFGLGGGRWLEGCLQGQPKALLLPQILAGFVTT